MRFEVLVGLVVRHDVGPQGGREEESEMCGRDDGIRGDSIPLAQLISDNAFSRPPGD